jgi:hypothetical protein
MLCASSYITSKLLEPMRCEIVSLVNEERLVLSPWDESTVYSPDHTLDQRFKVGVISRAVARRQVLAKGLQLTSAPAVEGLRLNAVGNALDLDPRRQMLRQCFVEAQNQNGFGPRAAGAG